MSNFVRYISRLRASTRRSDTREAVKRLKRKREIAIQREVSGLDDVVIDTVWDHEARASRAAASRRAFELRGVVYHQRDSDPQAGAGRGSSTAHPMSDSFVAAGGASVTVTDGVNASAETPNVHAGAAASATSDC